MQEGVKERKSQRAREQARERGESWRGGAGGASDNSI